VADVKHSTLTTTDLHAPKAHASSHEAGGSDVVAAGKVKEAAGPTELTLGAIADGEFLKRIGATVVGSSAGIVTYADVAAAEAASGSDNDLCYVVATDTLYRYEADGVAYTDDNEYVLSTGDGGNTRWLAKAGRFVVDQLNIDGRLTVEDDAAIPPLNITERAAEPTTPAAGDIYLDNGTNTGSGNPGWRRCVSTGPNVWEDITAAAGGGGGYVPRNADGAAWDFQVGDLTTDGSWRDLDLSGILPANAIAAQLRLRVEDGVVGNVFNLRRNGNANALEATATFIQVANQDFEQALIIPCDANQVIEYWATNTVWTVINIHVLGWWL